MRRTWSRYSEKRYNDNQRNTSVSLPVPTTLMNRLTAACLLTGFALSAGAESIPFKLEIDHSGSPSIPIIADGLDEALLYTPGSGVEFVAGATGSYDNPFFCFDFSSDAAANGLAVLDPNGRVVVQSPALQSSLVYDPDSNPEARTIRYSPGSDTQCFYTSTETINDEPVSTFGLFGDQTPSARGTAEPLPLCSDPDVGELDPCRYFANDFAAFPELELDIVIEGVIPQGGTEPVSLDLVTEILPGDSLVYTIVLANVGSAAAQSIALQEVFPSGSAFDAWLLADEGNEPLRRTDLQLPANESLEFEFTRVVDATLAGPIHLTAGAVNGPGNKAEWAVAQKTIDISL